MAKREEVRRGLGVSGGIGIGRAVCFRSRTYEVFRIPLQESQVGEEIERFRQAVALAHEEIQRIQERARRELGDEMAAIFEAHSLFLDDDLFLLRIEERIREKRINAEWAVYRTAEELEARFSGLESPHLRARAEDLQDVSRYLLRSLQGIAHHELSEVEGDVVIVADDLTPSDAVRLGRQRVVGLVIEGGGQTSHTTIIARSLHLPLVGGVAGITQAVGDEDPVVVDGTEGTVTLHPRPATLQSYRQRQRELSIEVKGLERTRILESVTLDGHRVELMANIDLPEEIEEAVRYGACGVGLYRSEFLYIEKSPELPDEEEHLRIYSRLLEAMAPNPVVIRTYDLGGRKLAREIMATDEDNPVLGLRGIRLTLARPKIFEVQVRALLRSGLRGNLWVLLPMVSGIEEVRAFRDFVARVMEDLDAEGVSYSREFMLGAMVEVPSAAMTADILAREVDFLSIGTNDLIQYSLAVDRNNEHVSYLYRPLHPAILRMIRFVVDSACAAGTEVALCGEMASDVRFTPLLAGLGVQRLSMSPRTIPAVKERIRTMDLARLRALALRCVELGSADEIESCLERYEQDR